MSIRRDFFELDRIFLITLLRMQLCMATGLRHDARCLIRCHEVMITWNESYPCELSLSFSPLTAERNTPHFEPFSLNHILSHFSGSMNDTWDFFPAN